jgi:hypothetical protein
VAAVTLSRLIGCEATGGVASAPGPTIASRLCTLLLVLVLVLVLVL